MPILLEARNIRVEFGPLVAVDDVSFDLSGGELLGLVGPNGAGKTTLMRTIAGLQAPTSGIAYVLGQTVLGENEVVRHHISFAPDTPPAYEELTIDQFLRFISRSYDLGKAETEERIDFWLEQLWLVEKRHTLIKNLSRGMRQRVTLARTFIPQPHVILLDEPLSGLDPAGRIQLRNVLGMLRQQGCALVVSSHILADLEAVATHIAIIERGRVLSWNTAEALHHEREERRTYRMVLLDGRMNDAVEMLKEIEGISDVRCDDRQLTFDYHAEEPRAAELLKRIVNSDFPIISFGMVKASLEEAYLRAGVKQVD